MAFDAGALIYKIQVLGAQQAQSDLRSLDASFRKVGSGASESKGKVDAAGKATDDAAKKSRDAKRPLDEQAKATENVGKKSRDAAGDQEKQKQATEGQVQAARNLSLALIAVGAAATAMIGMSVARHTEFDQAMSNVRAATMATADEQERLGESALQAGADTAYSATEAAAAQEELAKAGLSVDEVIRGGLNGALALAAAGQLEVARSAEIMATTLTQFGLKASDAAQVSDVLAAGAGKAQGSVDDLALALQYVGPLAAQAGWSLEETGGALAYFATQGILGEKAGTSLRGVMAALQSPSKIATRTMEEYGLTIYDANGAMLSAAEVAGNMQAAFGDLSQEERNAALGRIFGNESLLAATLLYKGGSEEIRKWTDEVNDTGYAAEQAAMRQDNLAGDVEKLGGAFETALIKTGSGANDVLREQVQALTALVDGYGELPGEVQEGVLVFGVLAAAVTLASGAALGLTARFSEMRRQLELNNISMGKTALLGAGVGLALAGVLTAVAVLAQKHAEARQRAEAYAAALEQGADAAREFVTESLSAEKSHLWISRGSAAEAAAKFGLSLETITDAAEGNKEALAEMTDVIKAGEGDTDAAFRIMEQYGLTLAEVSSASTVVAESQREMSQAKEDARRKTREASKVTEESIPVTQTAAEAYMAEADGVRDLESQLRGLIDTINEANGIGQDAIASNLAYKDALAAVDETIRKARAGTDENGDGVADFALSLDESTEAGRENKKMLVDLAKDAQEAAAAQFELDGNTTKYRETLEASRQALIDRAEDLGDTTEEAELLADQIFRIPEETEWRLIADTVPAVNAINGLIRAFDGKTITLKVGAQGQQTYTRDGRTFYEADGGKVQFYADGGRSEHRVAQFARAGDWRVWAEPETGGEWYLPNSPAKRGRSLAIAQQMLAEWGFDIVPAAAPRFANGSPVSPEVPSRGRAPMENHFHYPPGVDEAALSRATVQDIAELMRGE